MGDADRDADRPAADRPAAGTSTGTTPEQRARAADPAQQALLSALVTEHFALMGGRGNTASEAATRGSLYLSVLSSVLVATGFLGDRGALRPFLACALPVVVALGLLTWARLVELGIEDLRYLRAVLRIRQHYAGLTEDAARFFPDLAEASAAPDPELGGLFAYMGIRAGPQQVLLTAAATVAAVNSAVVGIGAALLVGLAGSVPAAVAVGVAVAAAAYLLHVRAQWRANVRALGPASGG